MAPIFRIDEAVYDAFPNARFSAVVVLGANSDGAGTAAADRLAEMSTRLRDELAGKDLKALPGIAVWREAFGSRGWTPSKYLSSIEALTRRVIKGGSLPSINPAVDLANSISLEYRIPVGAHDLGTAPGGIAVRLAQPDDRFRPMGEGSEETPDPDEIVYASGNDVRTRRWVWRQSRTGLVSHDTRDILFPIDGFAPETDTAVREAAETLAQLARELLGGSISIHHLTPDNPQLD